MKCPAGRNSVELSRYLFEPLRENGEFILYRGQRRNQTDVSPILLLAPVSVRPAIESLHKLEQEYSLRNELDPTWAVRPLAFSAYNGQRVLVLEDPGGQPLSDLIQGSMEMKQFLR